MTAIAALSGGLTVALVVAALLGVPAPTLRLPRRGRDKATLEERLREAGAGISPGRYRAVVTATAAAVGLLMWWATGAMATAGPPALGVFLAPRYWFARARRQQLRERTAAWPEALRDVVGHLASSLTLNLALVELGKTGPDALRPTWRRFAINSVHLGVEPALDAAQRDLADPMSDRVIEVLRELHVTGGSELALELLDDLIEMITTDTRQAESLHTAQYELRVQSIVVAILPFVVLGMICSGHSGFRAFYSTPGGLLVVAIGAAMTFGGWAAVDRLGRLPIEPRFIKVAPQTTATVVDARSRFVGQAG